MSPDLRNELAKRLGSPFDADGQDRNIRAQAIGILAQLGGIHENRDIHTARNELVGQQRDSPLKPTKTGERLADKANAQITHPVQCFAKPEDMPNIELPR